MQANFLTFGSLRRVGPKGNCFLRVLTKRFQDSLLNSAIREAARPHEQE